MYYDNLRVGGKLQTKLMSIPNLMHFRTMPKDGDLVLVAGFVVADTQAEA